MYTSTCARSGSSAAPRNSSGRALAYVETTEPIVPSEGMRADKYERGCALGMLLRPQLKK